MKGMSYIESSRTTCTWAVEVAAVPEVLIPIARMKKVVCCSVTRMRIPVAPFGIGEEPLSLHGWLRALRALSM
jgi:hypothetical protein